MLIIIIIIFFHTDNIKEKVQQQAERAKRWLFDLLDKDKDAVVTPQEAQEVISMIFSTTFN